MWLRRLTAAVAGTFGSIDAQHPYGRRTERTSTCQRHAGQASNELHKANRHYIPTWLCMDEYLRKWKSLV